MQDMIKIVSTEMVGDRLKVNLSVDGHNLQTTIENLSSPRVVNGALGLVINGRCPKYESPALVGKKKVEIGQPVICSFRINGEVQEFQSDSTDLSLGILEVTVKAINHSLNEALSRVT